MLDEQHKRFINEYIQSYSIEGAALKAGYPREQALNIGLDLLSNPEIQEGLSQREKALEIANGSLKMTRERLLRTMYFQYTEATKRGRVADAINILEKIARWSGVEPDDVQLEPVELIINNLDENKI